MVFFTTRSHMCCFEGVKCWAAFRQILLERVRAAAGAQRVRSSSAPRTPHPSPQLMHDSETIIAIGSSTGGTEALMEIFRVLPASLPGIVVVQHMPENLTDFFAQNLNRVSPMEIKEARDGDEVCPGRALIARGNNHMAIRGMGINTELRPIKGQRCGIAARRWMSCSIWWPALHARKPSVSS